MVPFRPTPRLEHDRSASDAQTRDGPYALSRLAFISPFAGLEERSLPAMPEHEAGCGVFV